MTHSNNHAQRAQCFGGSHSPDYPGHVVLVLQMLNARDHHQVMHQLRHCRGQGQQW